MEAYKIALTRLSQKNYEYVYPHDVRGTSPFTTPPRRLPLSELENQQDLVILF